MVTGDPNVTGCRVLESASRKLLNGRKQITHENTDDGYHNQVKHCSSPTAMS
jgi:hypothetical protein